MLQVFTLECCQVAGCHLHRQENVSHSTLQKKKSAGGGPKTASKFEAHYRIPSIGKPDGLMVWAAMNGSGQLIVKRMPKIVHSAAYIATLESAKAFIQPKYACKHFFSRNTKLSHDRMERVVFQHDGASVHRSRATQTYLKSKCFREHNGVYGQQTHLTLTPLSTSGPRWVACFRDKLLGTRKPSGGAFRLPAPRSPPRTLSAACTSRCRTGCGL